MTFAGCAFGLMAQSAGNYSIDIPADARLQLGVKPNNKHFVDFTPVSPVSTEEHAGVKTLRFDLISSQVYNYRVWKEGGLTHAGYFTMNSDASKRPVLAFDDSDFNSHSPGEINHDPLANGGYETGSIFVNINPRGHLRLASGATFDAHAMRSWELTNNVVNNYFFEPDFHYAVYDLDGKPCDNVISILQEEGSAWATIEALRAGTVIVVVTYEAINVNYYNGATKSDFAGGSFWGAVWPENAAVYVVSVDDAENEIDPNMLLNVDYNSEAQKLAGKYVDAEHDVFYYLDDTPGYAYTFSPLNVSSVEIAYPEIGAKTMTFNGFGQDGVTKNSDGSYTLLLKEGRQIVRLADESGNAVYQVLTAKKCSRVLTNLSRPQSAVFQPGDRVGVQYKGLFHPANKLAGVYNMSAFLTYNEIPNGSTTVGTPNQYQFASNDAAQAAEFVIPYDVSPEVTPFYVIDKGVIQVNGFGDPIGNHRNISKTDGRLPNLNAVSHKSYFGALPELKVALEPMKLFNIKIEANVDDVDISLICNGVKTVEPGDDGIYAWTYGDYQLTAVKPGYHCFRYSFSLTENDPDDRTVMVEMTKGSEGMWDGVEVDSDLTADADGVYHVSTGAQLAYLAQVVNEKGKKFTSRIVLDNDIDLGAFDWTPIGNKTNYFAGAFDGQGHKVTGLYIDDPDLAYAGLFGYVQGLSTSPASVSNLTVEGFVASTKNVGGVAGCLHNYASLSKCANTASVKGNSYVGGVVGYFSGSTSASIANCYNEGDVSGASSVGGVVGYNNKNAVISRIFNVGSVLSDDRATAGACVGGSTAKTKLSEAYAVEELGVTENHTLVTPQQMASGEIAYKLGDPFFQTIDVDLNPVFFGPEVFYDEESGEYYNFAVVRELKIDQEEVTLDIEDQPTFVLTASFAPGYAEEPEVEWTSSDENVVKIEHDGKLSATLTGLQMGEATVKVAHKDNPEVYDACRVYVAKKSGIADLFDVDEISVTVYDCTGRVIMRNVAPDQLQSLSSGLYIFKSPRSEKKVLIK